MPSQLDGSTTWMRLSLLLAALYNLIWGGLVVLFPNVWFTALGMQPPNYPELWQCIGMIVGVYGIGYAIAAGDPRRHWPIVLVGLLGKVFGPIGFAWALWRGVFPPTFGAVILTNDLIWWVPFGGILWRVYRDYQQVQREHPSEDDEAALMAAVAQAGGDHWRQLLTDTRTHLGDNLWDLSQRGDVLLVFLRHFGCTFAREAIQDVAQIQTSLAGGQVTLVFVHTSDELTAGPVFSEAGMGRVHRVSDPHCTLYRSFGLVRGSMAQLFGPEVWVRGFEAGILNGHGVGPLKGNGFQMPGLALLRQGRVIRRFAHQKASDRPDYMGFIEGACSPPEGGSCAS